MKETYTHIIASIFGKDGKPLFQECNHLICHLVQFVHQCVPIHEAEASGHRVVDEEHVGKLIPTAVVQP